MPEPELIPSSEAARRLGVHPKTLALWARDGQLPSYRTPGGHRRFRPADIDAFLKQERHPDTPGAA